MLKILIIEDEKELREHKNYQRKEFHKWFLEAEDGQKSEQLAIGEIPNLIICDILMPKLDDYAVLHQLRKNTYT
jgi:CheY-like chemotaxis protein